MKPYETERGSEYYVIMYSTARLRIYMYKPNVKEHHLTDKVRTLVQNHVPTTTYPAEGFKDSRKGFRLDQVR